MEFHNINSVFIDYILSLVGPNTFQNNKRDNILLLLKKLIYESLDDKTQSFHIKILSFGSYSLKSYIIDSDLDLTIILIDSISNLPFTNYNHDLLNEILIKIKNCFEKFNLYCGMSSEYIKEVSIINADVRLIKCKIENISIDISINNFLGLTKVLLMKHIEESSFPRLLFKRSLVLIKIWSYYEVNLLGSNVSLLGSYALETLVIFLFNNYSDYITNEVTALFTFIKVMNKIDYEKYIITIHGLIPKETFIEACLTEENGLGLNEVYQSLNYNLEIPTDKPCDHIILRPSKKIKLTEVDSFKKMYNQLKEKEKIQNFNTSRKYVNLKYINIIDALSETNNLGKSVNYFNFTKLQGIFEYLSNDIKEIESFINYCKYTKYLNENDVLHYLNMLLRLFKRTIIKYNDELKFINTPHPKIFIMKEEKKDNHQQSTVSQSPSFSNLSYENYNTNTHVNNDLYIVNSNPNPIKSNYFHENNNQNTSHNGRSSNIQDFKLEDEEKEKESPFKLSNLLKGEVKKQNIHNSFSAFINHDFNMNSISPMQLCKIPNSPYLSVIDKGDSLSKESYLMEFLKIYSPKDVLPSSNLLFYCNFNTLSHSIHWPNSMEINIKTESSNVNNIYDCFNNSIVNNKQCLITKEILEFFNKKTISLYEKDEEDYENSLFEVEFFMKELMKMNSNTN